jgi:hypothetical protein
MLTDVERIEVEDTAESATAAKGEGVSAPYMSWHTCRMQKETNISEKGSSRQRANERARAEVACVIGVRCQPVPGRVKSDYLFLVILLAHPCETKKASF